MIVDVSEGDEVGQLLRRTRDVATYLNRHSVEVVTERVRPDEVGAANSLLQFIHDENIKLIVAGAYGHSRLGEWHSAAPLATFWRRARSVPCSRND